MPRHIPITFNQVVEYCLLMKNNGNDYGKNEEKMLLLMSIEY